MSDTKPEDARAQLPQTQFRVEKSILNSARLPFAVSLISVLSITAIFVIQLFPAFRYNSGLLNTDAAVTRILLPNALYILLAAVAALSAYIGYRLTVAAGATRNPVIPPEDYELLSPLVRDGKAESIDQYVRLSSLAKFTGTFTQLGLTGLPLATIFLTLLFSILTLFNSLDFLDLTKLTLGAFIGSFVQRQVERRADASSETAKESLEEAVSPRNSA